MGTTRWLGATLAATLLLTGCSSTGDKPWLETTLGAAVGAGAGYLIDGKKGALVGAAIGGLAGWVIGREYGADAPPEKQQDPGFQQAREMFDKGNSSDDPMEAIYYYDQSIELEPGQPEAYNNRGLAYLKLGERAAARQSFEEALAVDPGYEPARQNLKKLAA